MPNGEGQPFMKFDQEKNRLELIEPEFIEGIGKVLTYGAVKYAAWNWRKVDSQEDLDRIKGATLRHMMAYMRGEKTDPDTGLSHLYHMGCNLMFLDYFDRKGLKRNDDVMDSMSYVMGGAKIKLNNDFPHLKGHKDGEK